MRKLLVAAGTAAFLAASTLAALAEETTGVIVGIDATAGTVTLQNGETFVLPESVDVASLEVSEQIKIEYAQGADGLMTATAVQAGAM